MNPKAVAATGVGVVVLAASTFLIGLEADTDKQPDLSKTAAQVVAPTGLVGSEGTPGLANVIDKTFSKGQCAKNFCWTCNEPVALDSVSINVDTKLQRLDAVKFTDKCTGVIDSLTITTQSADGLKVAGAKNLEIDGGVIKCVSKLDILHQDAVQVMGGSHIHFHSMVLDCGRESDGLIDSNFFVNMAGGATNPPDDITCDHCWLGPFAASTVNLQTSINSGVSDSTICPGKFFNFRKGAGATNPVDINNVSKSAC